MASNYGTGDRERRRQGKGGLKEGLPGCREKRKGPWERESGFDCSGRAPQGPGGAVGLGRLGREFALSSRRPEKPLWRDVNCLCFRKNHLDYRGHDWTPEDHCKEGAVTLGRGPGGFNWGVASGVGRRQLSEDRQRINRSG